MLNQLALLRTRPEETEAVSCINVHPQSSIFALGHFRGTLHTSSLPFKKKVFKGRVFIAKRFAERQDTVFINRTTLFDSLAVEVSSTPNVAQSLSRSFKQWLCGGNVK